MESTGSHQGPGSAEGSYLISIEGPNFSAGLVFSRGNIVIKAAPIIKWMLGWSHGKVVTYCDNRRWKYEVVKDEVRQQWQP